MKKKILIGSIFAVLLMLSMPMISNIQAQQVKTTVIEKIKDDVRPCPAIGPPAIIIFRGIQSLNSDKDNGGLFKKYDAKVSVGTTVKYEVEASQIAGIIPPQVIGLLLLTFFLSISNNKGKYFKVEAEIYKDGELLNTETGDVFQLPAVTDELEEDDYVGFLELNFEKTWSDPGTYVLTGKAYERTGENGEWRRVTSPLENILGLGVGKHVTIVE